MRTNYGVPSLSHWQSSPGSRALRLRRLLRCEVLEARYALSSITLLETDACEEPTGETTYEEPALATQPATDDASDETLVGPVEADAYYSALDLGTSTTQEPEGESNSPPVIDQFEIDVTNGYWFVHGHVTDDQIEMPGHVVRFGGLLEGHQTTPMSDGYFYYFTMMPPGTTGMVSAIATDNTGLKSPIVFEPV